MGYGIGFNDKGRPNTHRVLTCGHQVRKTQRAKAAT